MEEGFLHVELVNNPPTGQSKREHCTDPGGLHHRAKGLVGVDAQALSEATKHPSSLLPLKGSINMELVLEDPLARDDVGVRRARYELPGVVLQKCLVFRFHCSPPIGIGKGAAEPPRNWRQGRRLVHGWKAKPGLGTSIHPVVVHDRRDGNSTLGKGRHADHQGSHREGTARVDK